MAKIIKYLLLHKHSNTFLRSLLTISLVMLTIALSAQEKQDTQVVAKNKLFGLPIAFFAPETNWGFGAAGIYTFRLKGEATSTNPSQLQLGFAYTLNKQWLLYLPFQLFKQQETFKIYGELGYYLYTYQFYGIGNDTKAADKEFYDVNFPRVRINFLKQIRPNVFAGLRYWMDDFTIKKIAPDGLLDRQIISGQEGGLLSGVGAVFNYDNRDNIFFPRKGAFIELVGFSNGQYVGSDFNFTKLYLDASTYHAFKEQVLAVNLYTEFTSGDVPFNQLSLLGGPKRMRGHFEGRFRDKQFISLQTEYRFPLFWKWLRGVVFAGVGEVAPTISDFELANFKYHYGAGLRVLVNAEEQVYLRIDAGFGKETSGFYITIGEAF